MTQPSDIVDWVKWFYENGMLAVMQAILVVGGLFFAGIQLMLARRSFQATVVGQVSDRSSRLQWDVMKDPDLQPLLGIPSATAGSEIAELKRERALALILNHFAYIYDVWRLGGMPKQIWRTFQTDLGVLVSRPEFRGRWSRLKGYHRREFIGLVDQLISKKAKAAGRDTSGNQEKGQGHEGN